MRGAGFPANMAGSAPAFSPRARGAGRRWVAPPAATATSTIVIAAQTASSVRCAGRRRRGVVAGTPPRLRDTPAFSELVGAHGRAVRADLRPRRAELAGVE